MFLVQSTASLHASLRQLNHNPHGNLGKLNALVQAHTRERKIDAENIRQLADVVASRHRRLEEGGEAS